MTASKDYLLHAAQINKVAGTLLKLETKDATSLEAKISIGLSMQAAELAGKGILRGLGKSVDDIKRQHRNHDLLALLRSAEAELQQRQDAELKPYHHFLLWAPMIDGQKFGNTIAAYLTTHFASGAPGFPRNYFYPDEATFVLPTPIQAIYVMVEHLIEVAGEVLAITDPT